VTGRFSQERRGIWELKVEGDAEPIGVTPHHPLWSLDRHAWTSASELRPYERLATLTGPARLVYAIDTHIADPVYNIEVEGENCYRVGETGTLVHNTSGGCDHRTTHQATFGPMHEDSVGTSVAVQVTKRMLVSGSHSTFSKPTWWDPDYANYRLGHIWASTLGGPGTNSYHNMTPLFEKANSRMRSCEIFAKRLVDECCYCIRYSVTVNDYGLNDRSGRPPKALVPKSVTISIMAFKPGSPTINYSFEIPNTPNANTNPQDCQNKQLPCRS
jgi:hypothetical protein